MRVPVLPRSSAEVRHVKLDTKPCFKPHLGYEEQKLKDDVEFKNDYATGRGNIHDNLFAGHKGKLTYKMANFLGFNVSTGNKAKQIIKHARAARLQPPKTSNRSHLLTMILHQSAWVPRDIIAAV